MDKRVKGAWIVHHGRKIASTVSGAADYSATDISAKSAELLIRLSESDEAVVPNTQAKRIAQAAQLNPKSEYLVCLEQLREQRLVDVSTGGDVAILGMTSGSALGHAADLFDRNEPESHEIAALAVGELVSKSPVQGADLGEYISDEFKIRRERAVNLLDEYAALGFVDCEGDGDDQLFFNGNLFRRETASKTAKILDTLTHLEQESYREFRDRLSKEGAMSLSASEAILGKVLLSKLRAGALIDVNVVSNEAGDHGFITAPEAFHKYSNPMCDDAFDLAKSLVSALRYGMDASTSRRGRIVSVEALLRKLLNGEPVGPAPAIGKDYRYLELNRVLKLTNKGWAHEMRLLKRDVGELALQVLQGNGGSEGSVEKLPDRGAASYTPPEQVRAKYRRKTQSSNPDRLDDFLRAIRGQGGL